MTTNRMAQILGRDSFLRRLMELYRDFQARVAEDYAAQGYAGISATHTMALASLDAAGCRIADVAERLNITRQFAGRVVQELAARRMVTTEPDPADGRAVLVRLTGEGETFLEVACAVRDGVEAEYRAAVGDDLFADFMEALARLNRAGRAEVPPTTLLE